VHTAAESSDRTACRADGKRRRLLGVERGCKAMSCARWQARPPAPAPALAPQTAPVVIARSTR